MLYLYDGNNYYRTKLENRMQMQAPREILASVWERPDIAHVFVWDGIHNNAWRRDLYPGYKGKRKQPHESIFQHIKLLKEALQHTAAIQISIPYYEADDVIAAIATSTEQQVVILSNDYDFEQLRVHKNIHPGCKSRPHVPPHHVQLYKSVVGDSSDNIKGIPGFGDEAWKKLNVGKLLEILDRRPYDTDLTELTQCGFSKKCATWFIENPDEWENMYTIVGFRSIPEEIVLRHMKHGVPNSAKCYALLEEFMQ